MLRVEALESRYAPAAFLGQPWPQPGGVGSPFTLTYSADALYSGGIAGGMSQVEMRESVSNAFAAWSQHTPITFFELPKGGDIQIGVRNLGGRFGEATPPNLGGDVTVDVDQLWASSGRGTVAGIHLTQVLAHEIGHALGLDHTPVQPSLMDASSYRPLYDGETVSLFADDIKGIQTLYGAGTGETIQRSYRDTREVPNLTVSDPFEGYTGPIGRAAFDRTNDGVADLVVVADNGHVKVFDGLSRRLVASYLAMGANASGVVGVGEYNGDGVLDPVIVQAGRVKAVSGVATDAVIFNFAPFANYAGPLTVAVQFADVGGGTRLMVGADNGHVKVFDRDREVASFLAFERYAGTLTLAGSIGTQSTQTFTATANNGHVKTYDPASGMLLASVLGV